ncbi:MAG: O-antigen translocase [Solibacillus sp.]
MNFLKASILSGIATIIKLGSGLIINKIIAMYIGPAGVALIGQFQNCFNIIVTIGNGAINQGVTKYVAEYHEVDNAKRDRYISASFIITFLISILLGIVIFLFSNHLSMLVFKSDDYYVVFRVLATTLLFIGLNSVILSLINGLKRIRLFVLVNICGSLLGLIFTTVLTMKFEVWGALLSTVLVQTLLFFISFVVCIKRLKIQFKFNINIPQIYYKKLFSFSLMAIVAVISVSLSQLMIRNHIIDNFSIDYAGYWQAIWMISTMYLTILTTAFATYYLPTLSKLEDPVQIRQEILAGYKIIVPFVFLSAASMYFMRDIIIMLLFTPDFYPMRELFLYQFVGDFFKMCSWLVAYLMIAKSMTKSYIATEIIFALLFYVLTVILTEANGLIGVVQAHAINYFIYMIVVYFITRKWIK